MALIRGNTGLKPVFFHGVGVKIVGLGIKNKRCANFFQYFLEFGSESRTFGVLLKVLL